MAFIQTFNLGNSASDLTHLLLAQFEAIPTVRVGPDHRVRRIWKIAPEEDTVGPREFGQQTQCVLVSGQCQVVEQALCFLHGLIRALRAEVAIRQHVRDPACEIGERPPRMAEDDLAARVFADSGTRDEIHHGASRLVRILDYTASGLSLLCVG